MKNKIVRRCFASIVLICLFLSVTANAFTPLPQFENGFAYFDGRTIFNPTSGHNMTLEKCIVRWEGDDSILEIPSELGDVEMEKLSVNAISECETLEKVILPNSPMRIEAGAIKGCPNLEIAVIHDSVIFVGNPFVNCPALNTFVFDEAATRYGEVDGCLCDLERMALLTPNRINLGNVIVPEGIRVIGYMAFDHREDVSSVVLPDGLTEIDSNAFSYCTGLSSIEIPKTLTSIGSRAFLACTGLTDVHLPESILTIYDSAFRGCTNLLTLVIPNSVGEIGDYAFSMCDNLNTVYLPKSVHTIGDKAFDKSPNVQLIVERNSYAESWANEHGVLYVYQ